MKKQILLLVLALFAATTAFGQMKAGSAPLPLVGCTNDALHPLAGVPYNYKAAVTPTGGNFQWWATKDFDFIKDNAGITVNNSDKKLTVGMDLINASASYGATTTTDNVDITWASSTITGTTVSSPTFVVVQYDAASPACANNLKVYPILPINGFTVDIKNMDQSKNPVTNYGDQVAVCISNIASAKYDAVAKAVVTDYGKNILYYEVVAANFTGSYTPSFKVSGMGSGQTVASLELYIDAAFATPAIPTTLNVDTYSPDTPLTVDQSVTNTTNGVSIYVKLTIANGVHETLTDDIITLAVNGINASGEKSADNNDCSKPSDFNDLAIQTLTKRPTVTSVPANSFITQ